MKDTREPAFQTQQDGHTYELRTESMERSRLDGGHITDTENWTQAPIVTQKLSPTDSCLQRKIKFIRNPNDLWGSH